MTGHRPCISAWCCVFVTDHTPLLIYPPSDAGAALLKIMQQTRLPRSAEDVLSRHARLHARPRPVRYAPQSLVSFVERWLGSSEAGS